MAQLVLPFHEALDIASSVKPLPEEVESILCQDDTIHITLNAERALPRLLRAVSPRLKLALQYRDFEEGIASFDLSSSLFSLSTNKLVSLLLNLIPAPELGGILIENTPTGPKLRLDVNELIRKQVGGVEVTELYLHDNEFIVVANIRNFMPPPHSGEYNPPSEWASSFPPSTRGD